MFPFLVFILLPLAIATDPTVHLSTGTYNGLRLPSFDQDAFLGIPYAAKPERFTPSIVLVTNSTEVTDAKSYGTSCPAYGSDTDNFVREGLITMGEDCLSLNVVRPAGIEEGAQLPVAVWIYGGGWQQGATADPRYNLSYIIQQSVVNKKPVIGVSINYRTGGFGFLFSQAVMNSRNTNLGLRDQRTALEFIQANIAAFGGDPKKVTIWGESAGAYSVGAHLLSYGGRNDGLYRAAIMESGSAVGPPWNDTQWYEHLYRNITDTVNCTTALDTLNCLRSVPFETLYPTLNVSNLEWFAAIDGDFMREWPITATKGDRRVHVPLLLGSNTDEGTSFGVTGVNTDAEAVAQLISSERWDITTTEAEKILTLYPNDPSLGSPYGTGNLTFPSLGTQYKRYSSIAGDLTMAAPRRLNAATWAASKDVPVYSYRFDWPLLNTSSRIGIAHFSEIPYVFANTEQNVSPLGNGTGVVELSKLMARMWMAFVADGNVNAHGVAGVPVWPDYRDGPKNFVFRALNESYIEDDTYRSNGMSFINEILR